MVVKSLCIFSFSRCVHTLFWLTLYKRGIIKINYMLVWALQNISVVCYGGKVEELESIVDCMKTWP